MEKLACTIAGSKPSKNPMLIVSVFVLDYLTILKRANYWIQKGHMLKTLC